MAIPEIISGERKFCDGSPVCKLCGAPHRRNVVQACPARPARERKGGIVKKSTAGPPNLFKRFLMKCGSKKKWKAAGMPVRSQERVNEIMAICEGCEHFRGNHCGLCGCPLNNQIEKPTTNKIAMATEECPHPDGPKWTAETP